MAQPLAALLDDYGSVPRQHEFGFALSAHRLRVRHAFDNGLDISLRAPPPVRHSRASTAATHLVDPFRAAAPDSFFSWSCSTDRSARWSDALSGASPARLPRMRDGLSDPHGRDRSAFSDRARGAASDLGYDAAARRTPPPGETLAAIDSGAARATLTDSLGRQRLSAICERNRTRRPWSAAGCARCEQAGVPRWAARRL